MKFNSKPLIGILAFVVVLFIMPIGHIIMVLIEKNGGKDFMFPAAGILGLIGAILVWIGSRDKSELAATWLGFFGGELLWTGWVEFSFVWTAHHLDIPHLIENGEIATKAEYLIMPSSLGLLLATMVFYLFNNQTRCNFFMWLNKNFKLGIKIAPADKKRNFAIITALETIYITWFFYIFLLIIYDKSLFGDTHPVTYLSFAGFLIWSTYLVLRLLKITKMPYAVRYAIPTVIIFWNAVEILGRWNYFEEVWVEPEKYILETIMIFGGFVIAGIISAYVTRKGKSPVNTV